MEKIRLYCANISITHLATIFSLAITVNIGLVFSAHALESIEFVDSLNTNLHQPVDVALDGQGRIIALDEKSGSFNIYSPDEKFIAAFGSNGSKPGQMHDPQSVSISPEGNIVVADTGNNRVQVFAPDGKLLFSFGDSGSKSGQFSNPSGVAVDQAGYVYVADSGNKRLQSFSGTGVYIGTLPLNFSPSDVALDSQRNIYLLDVKDGKIVKFSPKGEKMNEFSCLINGKNYVSNASGLTVDQNGHIYFTELKEHSVKKIDESEVLRLSFGSEGEGRGQFQSPRGLAVLPSGQLYVADSRNRRIQILQVKGIEDRPLTPVANIPTMINFDKQIASNQTLSDVNYVKNYGLYALSDKLASIVHEGDSRQTFGLRGNKPGQFKDPAAINVTRDGRIFIADTGNNRLQILKADGTPDYEFGKGGDKPGYFSSPEGVTVSRKGNIYVADTLNDRIQIFTEDGIFLKSFGGTSRLTKEKRPEPGKFRSPRALAINSHSEIFVSDFDNDRIQIFDEDGGFLREFGSTGSLPGQFDNPADVAIDENDFIYVADAGNNRVQVFDPSGKFVVAFGSYGNGPGYFPQLSGIAASEGKIYVSDYQLNAVKVFSFNKDAAIGNNSPDQHLLAEFSSEDKTDLPSKERIYVTKIFHLPTDYSGDNDSLNEQVRQLTQNEAIKELAQKLGLPENQVVAHIKIESEDLNENGQYKMTISAPKKINSTDLIPKVF